MPATKAIVHVDGGARGNPGPAAAACVITSPARELLGEHTQLQGVTTNNVAEYRALLLGLQQARELSVSEVEVIGDSELIAQQVLGRYKVRKESLRPLHSEAMRALGTFERWSIRTVPRERNARADALVNSALDQVSSAGAG